MYDAVFPVGRCIEAVFGRCACVIQWGDAEMRWSDSSDKDNENRKGRELHAQ